MYINFINDRKFLDFMCLRDVEAGKQVTGILEPGIICIAITIFVNSSLFMNDPDKMDQSYLDRPSHERISNQELNSLEDSRNSDRTVRAGNGTIFIFQEDIDDSSLKMYKVILVKGD